MGEKIQEFGEYPTYWNQEYNISIKARAMFHQTFFETHPIESLLLSYSSHILEIYDYSSNIYQPTLVKNILIGNYNYSYIDDGTILSTDRGNDVERGIVSVGCSSDYIYIAYNPNKGDSETLGTQIQVVDWDGNPIKIMNTKKRISCLFIDEKERKGYVIVIDPEDTLMYFNLD